MKVFSAIASGMIALGIGPAIPDAKAQASGSAWICSYIDDELVDNWAIVPATLPQAETARQYGENFQDRQDRHSCYGRDGSATTNRPFDSIADARAEQERLIASLSGGSRSREVSWTPAAAPTAVATTASASAEAAARAELARQERERAEAEARARAEAAQAAELAQQQAERRQANAEQLAVAQAGAQTVADFKAKQAKYERDLAAHNAELARLAEEKRKYDAEVAELARQKAEYDKAMAEYNAKIAAGARPAK